MSKPFSINEVIDRGLIRVKFQTVLSHHKAFPKSVEAFIQGIHPEDGSVISPYALFQAAEAAGSMDRLNRMTIEKILKAYELIYRYDSKTILFINIHETLVSSENGSIEMILELMEPYGYNPETLVFDIGDYEGRSVEEVRNFISQARKVGFYISLDDIGKNYFNLDRILLYNPDIIKMNQQLIDRLPHESYRRRLRSQVSYIAHEMSVIVVFTGIETEESLSEAFTLGAQYFQGYYLCEPMVVDGSNVERIMDTESKMEIFKPYEKEVEVEESRAFMNKMVIILNRIREASKKWSKEAIEEAFDELFFEYPYVQNAWILDMNGIQVTNSRINNEGFRRKNAKIFRIYGKGHDYSSEQYYTIIKNGALDVWITKPYLSLLNNKLCFFTASLVEPLEGGQFILCLEVSFEDFRKMNKVL